MLLHSGNAIMLIGVLNGIKSRDVSRLNLWGWGGGVGSRNFSKRIKKKLAEHDM